MGQASNHKAQTVSLTPTTPRCGTPLRCFVAPQGAAPEAPVAAFACRHLSLWYTPHTLRCPTGSST
eukprot:4546440-Pyramimonas_sp.AAC.1